MKTILIIDDDTQLLVALSTLLHNEGYQCLSAVLGNDGLRLAREHKPDLILLDYKLPDLSGLDLLKAFTIDGTLALTPVILMSGEDESDLENTAFKFGADDFIQKPINFTKALHLIQLKLRRFAILEGERLEWQNRMLAILDKSYDLVALADISSQRLSYINPKGRTMLGLGYSSPASELLISDLFGESTNSLASSLAIQSTMEAGSWNGEVTLGLNNNKSTPVWLEMHLHGSAAKNNCFLSLSAHDISNRKVHESKLLQLSTALDQCPVAVIMTDTGGNIEYVNQHFISQSDYSLEEIKGRNASLLSSGKNSLELYQGLWSTITQNKVWTGELLNRSKSGKEYWVQCSISPLLDANGEICNFLCAQLDVSAQKKAQEELAFEQELMTALMNNIPDSIYFKDLNSRFIRINRAMAERFALRNPSEAIGKSDFDYFTQEHAQQAFEDERQIIQGGPPIIAKEEIESWEGKPDNWVSSTKMPLQDIEGNIIGTFGVSFDITKRKFAEKETLSLQAQLHQAQKLESIGQLAAGIAHEINTPTQYVSDNIQFLQKAFADISTLIGAYTKIVATLQRNDCLTDELAALVEPSRRIKTRYLMDEVPNSINDALEGLERVTKIVRAMKQFSHPGTDEMVPFDINKAIESTLTVSRNEWKYVANMETDLSPELPLVNCLPGEFNQVILNLVVNAAHAIADVVGNEGSNKGTIKVSTQAIPGFAQISIQDTGTGIPTAVQPRIFDQFFTTKEVGKGTGQGLALARSIIVDRHHGSIDFTTTPGKGTTFYIKIPL